MITHPDNLFREKLEQYSKPAPVDAWNRIEAGLDKRNNKGLYLKIAAGVALLSVAAFLLWPHEDGNHSNQLSEVEKVQPVVSESNKAIKPEDQRAMENTVKPAGATQEPKQNNPAKEKVNDFEESDNTMQVAATIETETSPTTESETVTITHNTSEQTPSSRTIVYSADEVNAKFLKKQSTPDATPDEKKSSGIQKLMGLAYTLKNTEAGLGDLRQKKDEILALNFRDKKQEQN